jgi:hypothetical protein
MGNEQIWNEQEIMPWESGIFLRLLEPGNPYRIEDFHHRNAVYIAKQDCVFIVVRQSRRHQKGLFSELAWLYPEEVRLLGTIALSVAEEEGMISLVPGERVALDIAPRAPLYLPIVLSAAEKKARSILASGFPGARYKLYSWRGFQQDFDHALFEAIDPSDDLVIRGLYCLLKSARLMGERDLGEEAVMNVQIAREASLELIREHLFSQGNKNPSFKDAHAYITQVMGNGLADLFEYQHELWVTMKHPSSAFGPVWLPPLVARDFYETYKSLVSVYRHILTGS